jgi:Fe-S oxidoreductase/nitrate reductase gamma subunit
MIKSADIFFITLALVLFSWGIYKRFRLWTTGKKEKRSNMIWTRIKSFLVEGIAHKKILQDVYPGLIHMFIFLGFMIPLVIIMITQAMFTIPSLLANSISLALDVIGLLAVVSLLLALYRRLITRPARLDNQADDFLILGLILFIILTGFILEGLRLSVIGEDGYAWAPVGKILASLWNITGVSVQTKGFLAMVVFRIHFFLVLVTIVYIPYSKLFHIVSSSLNMILRSYDPKGILSHLDLEDEEAESFGVAQIDEFTWKQLLDLDACTRCGRCQDHCPAYLTEKPLSPKTLILDLKNHMHSRAPQILEAKSSGRQLEQTSAIVSSIIKEDVLWACTTCRSCMEHCPVYVEHVDKVVDMRRYQVLMESRFPEELTACFRGLEKNSNPWGLGYERRAEWVKEIDVPVLSELGGEEIDLLFFVGCIRSFDDRNKKVAVSMTRILNHLGIKFAILGMEEGCCGDPARRVGNEYLYQVLAQTNIETFRRYQIKRILTTCPHCYNTLKNEYSQLGFSCEVVHHTVFLQENIKKGYLKVNHPLIKKLTYHDPCYLGRYSGIYEPPRDVLKSIPSFSLKEMKRSRIDSLCCGGGGGWMWMDEKIGKRMNLQRLEDALETKAEWIATACPFCVTMFDEAIKDRNLEEDVKIWDIVELVEQALSAFKKEGESSSESSA